MKRFTIAVLLILGLAGCGGGDRGTETEAPTTNTTSDATSTSAEASGCTASGLDAMTALSDFEMQMDEAQKTGTITTDQLISARNRLFDQTQQAMTNEDWVGYCKAIDDMRAELGL